MIIPRMKFSMKIEGDRRSDLETALRSVLHQLENSDLWQGFTRDGDNLTGCWKVKSPKQKENS